jgi:hypothetical protein
MGKSISDGVKPIGNLPFLLACRIGYAVLIICLEPIH